MDHPVSDRTSEEDARREALRKSGAEFMEKAMTQAIKGQDPFQAAEPAPRVQKERKQRQPKVDPEFVAFGLLLKDSLVYFYMGLYLICQTSSYVLIKVSFRSMQTPAVLTFLHMLSAAGGIYLASRYDVYERVRLSPSAIRGGSVSVVLYATQMLCIFSALHHNSVNVVIVWTTAGGVAIEAAVGYLLTGVTLEREPRLALTVGFGAGILELVFDTDKVAVGVLMLLLWSLSKAAECVWRRLREDATLGGRIADRWLVFKIREVADDEAQQPGSAIALMQNLLPAVPVLLLGFLCLEGKELVDHELSVPAVEVMLMACLSYTVSTCCQLLLDTRVLAPDIKLALRGVSLLGAVLFFAMEELGAARNISLFAVGLTLVSVAASLIATWKRKDVEDKAAALVPLRLASQDLA